MNMFILAGEPTGHRLRVSEGAFSSSGCAYPPLPEGLDDLAEPQVMGGHVS